MQEQMDLIQQNAENSILYLTALTVLGDRPDQQDSFGFQVGDEEVLAVVCDGMGGLKEGKVASQAAVNLILTSYADTGRLEKPAEFLFQCADRANEAVRAAAMEQNCAGQLGTTLVSAYIRGMDLYWLSVGDSRGYLYRSGAMAQFTQDHNMRTVLEEQKASGQSNQATSLIGKNKEEALISYLGMDRFELRDCSKEPLPLQQGDRILLTSDGLYKLVTDEEMLRILDNFTSTEEALMALELKARQKTVRTGQIRDNMTVILIELKQRREK